MRDTGLKCLDSIGMLFFQMVGCGIMTKQLITHGLPTDYSLMSLMSSTSYAWTQLFKTWITYSLNKSLSSTANVILFDAFGEISAQANNLKHFYLRSA